MFELLRIVAMFFIIVHHHLISVAHTCGYDAELYDYNTDGLTGIVINGFVVGGGKFVCDDKWLLWHTAYMAEATHTVH